MSTDYQAPTDALESRVTIADSTADGASLLDDLAREFEAEVVDTIKIVVPSREGWIVEFDNLVSSADLRRYLKHATPKDGRGRPGDQSRTDPQIMNGMLLLERNVAIYRVKDGEPIKLIDEDGDAVTLTSTAFLERFGEKGANTDALRALRRFLSEPGVVSTGSKVSTFAGWGEDPEEWQDAEDPTVG
jgi:hypothetical protein